MIDGKQLRLALSRFTTGITVLTIRDEQDTAYGVTVNSFSSVSLNPPLVLWSLGDQTYGLDQFLSVEHYVVNVLSSNQQAVSDTFSIPGEFDRFKNIAYSVSRHNIPVIEACIASFHCRRHNVDRVGDHWLFISSIEEFETAEGQPLLYYASNYCLLQ